MKFLRKLFQRKIFVIILFLLCGAVVGYFVVGRKPAAAQMFTVTRGTIAEKVSVTGKTQPVESVDLAFEKSGKVARVAHDVGESVTIGAVLVALDASELQAQFRQADAQVAGAEAKLDELKRGTRPEEIAIAEMELKNAEVALDNAKKNLLDKIQDAFTKSDDAIRNQIDVLFSNARSTDPQLNFFLNDGQLETSLKQGRVSMELFLNTWKPINDQLTVASDLSTASRTAQNNLWQIKSFLDKIAFAVNSLRANSQLSQATLDGWRSNVSVARTNINTATANLSAADEKFSSADSSVLLAQQQLSLKKAGSVPEKIAAQEAEVKQAEANRDSIAVQIGRMTLKSPIGGVVTRQDAKVGEIVAPNTVLVSVISLQKLEIEVNVPEVDIGKVAVGSPVHIRLDALPAETFEGSVIHIDPAETVVDGVVNFKVKVMFAKEDLRFKSGLTANLTIETTKKSGVWMLPQTAILETDQGTFVRIQQGKQTKDIPVTIGIRSQDGMVEIVSGVQEGEQVLNVGMKVQ